MSELVKLDIMSDGSISINGMRITPNKMYGMQTVEKSVNVSKSSIIKALDIEKEIYTKGYNQGTIDRAEEVTKESEHGYTKAIDEFAERLKEKAERESTGTHFPDGLYGEVVEVGELKNMIDKIAEEMRGAV